MRKRKNKKKTGDVSHEIIIKTMEEQTKQIKRLADNKAAEIEDIGRGNRTETSFNASITETGREQGNNLVTANPPPFTTTTSVPPPPFGQGHQEGQSNQGGYRPKVCKKLAKGLCTYGLSGFINGERCPEPHPKPCEAWRQKGKEGCSRGNQCRFYHQPPCQTVANSTLCENMICQFIHLPIEQLENPPTPAANQGY